MNNLTDNYGFDFNCYHISDDFNYISNAANASALSDILSNPSSIPVTSSLSTSTLNPSLQSNLSAYSHCNNSNMNLNSSLNSSSSSLSSCSSSTPSPPPSSAASPSSLSSSSSSCISITSMIDFQKLKNEMTNNIVKPKAERKSSNPSINLSSFSICQSKMETQPQSTSSSHSLQSNPSNNSTQINIQNNHQNSCQNNNNIPAHNSSNTSHEFTEEEKEGLQISPFLSSVQENYCDITEYLTLPQNQAAKKLQMRPSTFSKRWKEASRNRKWPWRNVRKIDKEITCILHNMPKNGQISEEIESHLTYLLKQRQEELKPVVIRIS